jgi:hypothetical protein
MCRANFETIARFKLALSSVATENNTLKSQVAELEAILHRKIEQIEELESRTPHAEHYNG